MKAFITVLVALCAVCINAEAPGYPASGWKPNGRLLALPARVQEVPKPVYGPPKPVYGPPSTTTLEFAPTTDIPSTTPTAEESSAEEGASAQQQAEPNVESGLYYVLLPDGRLQRVEYLTAPLGTFENEKQSAFPGFPGFEVKPLKIQAQPTTTSTQFQVGGFQGNQNQGFNSNQNNQAQASSNGAGFNKIQFKGQYQTAAFIQPVPVPAQPEFAPSAANYLLAPNPNAISAFASFQQYQAQKAAQQQQQQQQKQEVEAVPVVPMFQGFVSNVQYKDVEPISAPVYAYNAQQQQYVRILK